jgi:ferritin-like protein
METRYHETGLSENAKDIHRALASVMEEFEAIDWYHQRLDVTQDDSLKAILEHNRNEEMEHAAMGLEWLRRRMPDFDEALRTYLFTTQPVTEIEEEAMGGEAAGDAPAPGDLGIGNNK